MNHLSNRFRQLEEDSQRRVTALEQFANQSFIAHERDRETVCSLVWCSL